MPPADISSLNVSLGHWEIAEYIAVVFVIVGIVGEYFADFTKIAGSEAKKKILAKSSTWVLILALAAELICLVRTNRISDQIIAQLQKDTAEANSNIAQANAAAASAIEVAESERHERIKLEARVAPRSLSLNQQRLIVDALRKFSGQPVIVSSYGLDGEGANIGAQIISVLGSAGIEVTDNRASIITTGGFENGIHIRGPQCALLSGLDFAFSKIGELKVFVNDPTTFRAGATMGGRAEIRGNAAMGGGGGIVSVPVPTSGPISIMVGIKPVPIAITK